VRLGREDAEVVALVRRQLQRVGDRHQHLVGRVRVPALFEADEVVDAEAGQRRDLLAAQPRRAPAPRHPESHRGGRDALATGPQELAQLGAIGHRTSMPWSAGNQPGPAGTRIGPVYPGRCGGRTIRP
jgi:hypothetical protein